jgi:glycosyltransferase involved in cell wall biosynthesis
VRRQRIAFVINSLAGGGAERAMVNLLSHSGEKLHKFDVHLVLLDTEPDAFVRPAGVTLHRLNAGGKLTASLRQLCRVLLDISPSVVVSGLTRANLCAVLLAGALDYRTIICEHAHTQGHHHGFFGFIAKGFIRTLYPRADLVIGVSADIADGLVKRFGVSPSRMATIANPIDATAIRQKAEAPLPGPQLGPYVLGMGRLVDSKNWPLLVEAFALSGLSCDLVILGEGPKREAIEAVADRLGLAGRVQMPGFMANPFPVMKGALGYVLPSNKEGLPTGLIEAMILGVPVIATNCRSGPSEILAGQTRMDVVDLTEAPYGLLVPTNAAEPLSRALARLEDAAARHQLAGRAAAGAGRYDLTAVVDQYWFVIEAQLVQAYAKNSE